MYGAVFGDIIGSYYEIHSTKDYSFDMFRHESRFTDDTVMNIAVCDAILYNDSDINFLNLNKRAYEYAVRYKSFYSRYPSCGFGEMFSSWAKSKSMFHQRSYANGGAMRALPIGYAYKDIKQVYIQAKSSCMFTHRNREAIRGAEAVAGAVFMAHNGYSKSEIQRYIERKFSYNLDIPLEKIKSGYIFDSDTFYSVPPAIRAFLESENYEDCIRKAISLGGDADTMACIAGGIAEAYYKEIPDKIKSFCMSRLDMTMKEILNKFYEKYCITKGG